MVLKTRMNINIYPQRSAKCFISERLCSKKEALSLKTDKYGSGRSQNIHILGVGWGWMATVMGYEGVF